MEEYLAHADDVMFLRVRFGIVLAKKHLPQNQAYETQARAGGKNTD